jgi:hypothetical protein
MVQGGESLSVDKVDVDGGVGKELVDNVDVTTEDCQVKWVKLLVFLTLNLNTFLTK